MKKPYRPDGFDQKAQDRRRKADQDAGGWMPAGKMGRGMEQFSEEELAELRAKLLGWVARGVGTSI